MTARAIGICLLLSLPFLYVIARKPVLRRMAFRNATRRPREAALVVVGSMLGAAIITGSFVVGDAMNASIRQIAHEHLGPVDELVLAPDQSTWQLLSMRLIWLRSANVDGVLPIETMAAGVSFYKDGRVTSAPSSQVVGVDFPAASRFGREHRATGIWGAGPKAGHAAITTDLAKTLGVRVGGTIDISAYGSRSKLIVDTIFPRRGIAGFNLGQQQESRNVIVPPSAFDAIRGVASPYAAPPDYAVLVSNRGSVEGGAARTAAVDTAIRRAAAGLNPQLVDIKRIVLDQADATGKGFTQMFSTMGSFGVIAGLLLLAQLFVMLAAERKPELGMARAVGMRRSWLVGAFATEGWLYALAATLLGTGVGIGLGRALVAVSERAFNSEHNQLRLYFVLRPSSLAESFAIGFVIALLTIVVTSSRVSRLNIIRAIREIPEPPPRRRRRWVVVGGAAALLGAVWTVSAVGSTEPFGLLLGPTLLLFGLAPLAARSRWAGGAVSTIALAGVAWAAVAFALLPAAAARP